MVAHWRTGGDARRGRRCKKRWVFVGGEASAVEGRRTRRRREHCPPRRLHPWLICKMRPRGPIPTISEIYFSVRPSTCISASRAPIASHSSQISKSNSTEKMARTCAAKKLALQLQVKSQSCFRYFHRLRPCCYAARIDLLLPRQHLPGRYVCYAPCLTLSIASSSPGLHWCVTGHGT